jgi:hypothetical protein
MLPLAFTPEPMLPLAFTPEPMLPLAFTPEPMLPLTFTPEPMLPLAFTPEPMLPLAFTPEPMLPAVPTSAPTKAWITGEVLLFSKRIDPASPSSRAPEWAKAQETPKDRATAQQTTRPFIFPVLLT